MGNPMKNSQGFQSTPFITQKPGFIKEEEKVPVEPPKPLSTSEEVQ